MLEAVKCRITFRENFIVITKVVSGVKSVVCRGMNVQACIGLALDYDIPS